MYRSNGERIFAAKLHKRKVIFAYEPIKLAWQRPIQHYTPDFRITRADGSVFYVEYKGYFRPGSRTIMMYVVAQHPDLDIRMVFQDWTKRISKTSKTTYRAWCENKNIICANKNMPLAWMKK